MIANEKLTTLDLRALETVGDTFSVRARPRPRSADRARNCAHHAEPPLQLSLRVAMLVCQVRSTKKLTTLELPALTTVLGDLHVRDRPRPPLCARLIAPAVARITPSLLCWPRVRQVFMNAELTTLDLRALTTAGHGLEVGARPRRRSAD